MLKKRWNEKSETEEGENEKDLKDENLWEKKQDTLEKKK